MAAELHHSQGHHVIVGLGDEAPELAVATRKVRQTAHRQSADVFPHTSPVPLLNSQFRLLQGALIQGNCVQCQRRWESDVPAQHAQSVFHALIQELDGKCFRFALGSSRRRRSLTDLEDAPGIRRSSDHRGRLVVVSTRARPLTIPRGSRRRPCGVQAHRVESVSKYSPTPPALDESGDPGRCSGMVDGVRVAKGKSRGESKLDTATERRMNHTFVSSASSVRVLPRSSSGRRDGAASQRKLPFVETGQLGVSNLSVANWRI